MKTAVTMSVKEEKIVKEFEDYLIKMGYRVTTPSGKPSTVGQYSKGVERVINEEGITLFQLKEKISQWKIFKIIVWNHIWSSAMDYIKILNYNTMTESRYFSNNINY